MFQKTSPFHFCHSAYYFIDKAGILNVILIPYSPIVVGCPLHLVVPANSSALISMRRLEISSVTIINDNWNNWLVMCWLNLYYFGDLGIHRGLLITVSR